MDLRSNPGSASLTARHLLIGLRLTILLSAVLGQAVVADRSFPFASARRSMSGRACHRSNESQQQEAGFSEPFVAAYRSRRSGFVPRLCGTDRIDDVVMDCIRTESCQEAVPLQAG